MHYSIDNAQLNVLELGNGPLTLVFLHYFGGSSLEWRAVMDQLAVSIIAWLLTYVDMVILKHLQRAIR
ncbi:hypothetical protein [Spirosoma telluris]|uniref:alpha/beta fold hydrolase n=1 Tax=Spirosoma telluris TaxID=2183553 RepID=UPI002FC389C9